MFILGNYRGYKSTLKSIMTIISKYKMVLASKLGQISVNGCFYVKLVGLYHLSGQEFYAEHFCLTLCFQFTDG